jgi:hypothetical protein
VVEWKYIAWHKIVEKEHKMAVKKLNRMHCKNGKAIFTAGHTELVYLK